MQSVSGALFVEIWMLFTKVNPDVVFLYLWGLRRAKTFWCYYVDLAKLIGKLIEEITILTEESITFKRQGLNHERIQWGENGNCKSIASNRNSEQSCTLLLVILVVSSSIFFKKSVKRRLWLSGNGNCSTIMKGVVSMDVLRRIIIWFWSANSSCKCS